MVDSLVALTVIRLINIRRREVDQPKLTTDRHNLSHAGCVVSKLFSGFYTDPEFKSKESSSHEYVKYQTGLELTWVKLD